MQGSNISAQHMSMISKEEGKAEEKWILDFQRIQKTSSLFALADKFS